MKRNNMLREKRKHANYKPNRRLDAKSSRGMIYENEELRIRTININAEVEKGQSEIKTLKREREQLRREIWTLRDEYDKLENLLRIKGIDPDEFLNQNKDNNGDDDDEGEENEDYSDECSCESCCEEDCCDEKTSNSNDYQKSEKTEASGDSKNEVGSSKAETQQSTANSSKNSLDEHNKRSGKDRLNLNFDHLSVVSEEISEGNSMQNEDSSIPIHDISAFLHSVDVVSPLSYLQKLSPPLAHFENLNYEQIGGSNVDQHGNILMNTEVRPQQIIDTHVNNSYKPNGNVSETTNDSATAKKESRLKHFFSPIRKKPIIAQAPPIMSQPDVFISNILPSNMYVNPAFHLQNNPSESSSKVDNVVETASPTSSFQTGGNLEELLYDIEALSKDIMNLQTQCTNSPTDNDTATRKPYRSELNLVLAYPNQKGDKESFQPPSDSSNNQLTPPLPSPMELMNPLSHNNPLLLQHLPPPFPSPSAPSSPLTPPTNFKTDAQLFEKVSDYSHLNFPPINAPLPIFASNNSIFCTVSAPSTPASDRKCIDKFCINETNNDIQRGNDKKKSKRVSIVNTLKDDANDKSSESQEVNNNEAAKETLTAADKKQVCDGNVGANNHHSHMHKNHSHSHLHPNPKRRMSLDNTVNSAKHKNHRQICHDPNARVQRRESNRSSNSFKKRSRSDSNFAAHGDEGGTSVSERYSNSLASSRESSTSLSMKSGKRRISITSYGGSKKIPWCGCWGTSCI